MSIFHSKGQRIRCSPWLTGPAVVVRMLYLALWMDGYLRFLVGILAAVLRGEQGEKAPSICPGAIASRWQKEEARPAVTVAVWLAACWPKFFARLAGWLSVCRQVRSAGPRSLEGQWNKIAGLPSVTSPAPQGASSPVPIESVILLCTYRGNQPGC